MRDRSVPRMEEVKQGSELRISREQFDITSYKDMIRRQEKSNGNVALMDKLKNRVVIGAVSVGLAVATLLPLTSCTEFQQPNHVETPTAPSITNTIDNARITYKVVQVDPSELGGRDSSSLTPSFLSTLTANGVSISDINDFDFSCDPFHIDCGTYSQQINRGSALIYISRSGSITVFCQSRSTGAIIVDVGPPGLMNIDKSTNERSVDDYSKFDSLDVNTMMHAVIYSSYHSTTYYSVRPTPIQSLTINPLIDLGIGGITNPVTSTHNTNNGWQGSGKYNFATANFVTPYLTTEAQVDNWNYVLYGTPRMEESTIRPVALGIQTLNLAQRTAIKSGNPVQMIQIASQASGGPTIQITQNSGAITVKITSADAEAPIILNMGPSATLPSGTQALNSSETTNTVARIKEGISVVQQAIDDITLFAQASGEEYSGLVEFLDKINAGLSVVTENPDILGRLVKVGGGMGISTIDGVVSPWTIWIPILPIWSTCIPIFNMCLQPIPNQVVSMTIMP